MPLALQKPVLVGPHIWTIEYPAVEAMAAGVPCIATDVGDTARLIGETGILTQPGNVDELVAALSRMHRDVSARKELGRQARNRVDDHFSLEVAFGKYEALYEVMVRQRKDA